MSPTCSHSVVAMKIFTRCGYERNLLGLGEPSCPKRKITRKRSFLSCTKSTLEVSVCTLCVCARTFPLPAMTFAVIVRALSGWIHPFFAYIFKKIRVESPRNTQHGSVVKEVTLPCLSRKFSLPKIGVSYCRNATTTHTLLEMSVHDLLLIMLDTVVHLRI